MPVDLSISRIFRHPRALPHSNTAGVGGPAGYRLLWHETEITVRNVYRRGSYSITQFELWERSITQRINDALPKEIVTTDTMLVRRYRIDPLGLGSLLDVQDHASGQVWTNTTSRVKGNWGFAGAQTLLRSAQSLKNLSSEDISPSVIFDRIARVGQRTLQQLRPTSFTTTLRGSFSGPDEVPPRSGFMFHDTLSRALFGLYKTSSDPTRIILLYRLKQKYGHAGTQLYVTSRTEQEGMLSAYREASGFTTGFIPIMNRETSGVGTDVSKDTLTQIVSVRWFDERNKLNLEDLRYTQRVRIVCKVDNPDVLSATITIAREKGNVLKQGRQQLSFSVAVDEFGYIESPLFVIDPEWEDNGQDRRNRLLAKLTQGDLELESIPIEIIPSPKVVANFRPHDGWTGEFGFDWVRMGDMKLVKGIKPVGDSKYEDIVSKQYKLSAPKELEKDSNKFKGIFEKDPEQFEELEKKYKKFSFSWGKEDKKGNRISEDYLMPWLSVYEGSKAKVQFILDVTDEADYLEFEESKYFTFTPSKIYTAGKKGSVYLTEEVEIECIAEFGSDQTLELHACQRVDGEQVTKVVAGKISAWANAKNKQKDKKVVFVQVRIPGPGGKPEQGIVGSADGDKERIEKYLSQALINLHKEDIVVELDLSFKEGIKAYMDEEFVKSVDPSGSRLEDYLESELTSDCKDKYDNYFKAYYFGVDGLSLKKSGEATLISGYSRPDSQFVVIFPTANDQTAAHEFLHAFNLAHTFTNSEASVNAQFTYQYAKTDNLMDYTHHMEGGLNSRRSLWYWQWVQANESIK